MRRAAMGSAGLLAVALICTGHIGSPDVFFQGRAGPYDVRVVVRPPEVVPGVARVTVRAPVGVQRVSIRPIFWRAGSKGAPSADEARRLVGDAGTFEGSLWLMARGAYSVDVILDGARGRANILVPVASVATGRLEMAPALGALLVALGVVLCAGLVTIVHTAAGESLLGAADQMDTARRSRARRVAAVAVPIIALGLFAGARWWTAVDRAYERAMYRPSPLSLELNGDLLLLETTDTLWQPPRRPSAFVTDHGKLMHLFLIRADDARAFAHLHPQAMDTSAIPPFVVKVPPLPAGRYHVYGDVVHETGFERTLVGSLMLADSATRRPLSVSARVSADPDDAWFVGDASPAETAALADGSIMSLRITPGAAVVAGRESTIRISVRDSAGAPARLDPYLGMPAHGVVARLDGQVYVHLHPMGTISVAAQEAFLARDRGDTTASGRLTVPAHATHAAAAVAEPEAPATSVEFPYAFPKSGSYRVFVQVKHHGRILTGAFMVGVADADEERR